MCQQGEAEGDYMRSVERNVRRKGWDAFHAGIGITQNPEDTHPLQEYSRAYQWELGWLTAKGGKQPW